MDKANDFPFAEFFEEGLNEIAQMKPKGVLIAAIGQDGAVLVGSEGCTQSDMAILLREIEMRDIMERVKLLLDDEEEG